MDGDSVYEARPSDHLDLDVTIDFPHPLIGRQQLRRPDHGRDVRARARRGRVPSGSSARWSRSAPRGLIKGASTQNAVVLDDQGVVENDAALAGRVRST